MTTREEWPLLVLAAADDERLSPVQLQKVLFLIGENLRPDGEYYDFQPYHYGPFDRAVYQDMEELAGENMCLMLPGLEHGSEDYRLTALGRKRADQVFEQMDPDVADYIRKVVEWAKSLSFRQLITAIYEAYPQYRVRSVFKY